jgi:hypothetical protein
MSRQRAELSQLLTLARGASRARLVCYLIELQRNGGVSNLLLQSSVSNDLDNCPLVLGLNDNKMEMCFQFESF